MLCTLTRLFKFIAEFHDKTTENGKISKDNELKFAFNALY